MMKLKVGRERIWNGLSFVLLLFLYMTAKGLYLIGKKVPKQNKFQTLQNKLSEFYLKAAKFLDLHKEGSISRINLIELSLHNMKAKKTRTLITVGGMAIGVGAIVFLVSIGYGLQQLVISRVARLDEMRQADVSIQPGSKLKINDKTLADLKNLTDVAMALPLIGVVGRVNYQNSVSDMPVYGVTSDYLNQSAIKPSTGKIFNSNQLTAEILQGQVAGVSTEASPEATYNEKIQDVDFTIDPGAWLRVREEPSTNGKILGYTKRTEGVYPGSEVWGGSYEDDQARGKSGHDSQGKFLGRWVKAKALLWNKQVCDKTKGDCENGAYVVAREEDGTQTQKIGYFAELNLKITGVNIQRPSVLGISTDNTASESSTNNLVKNNTGGTLDFVEIASEAGIVKPPEVKTVSLASNSKRQAVVNRAMLKILGLKESEAVGKTFTSSFIVVGDLLSDPSQKLESVSAEYTIIGITPDEITPVFYVPFMDLRSLGISNYSQVKMIVKNQGILSKVRKQVEAMGYITRSVADTVTQITSLFSTLRTILGLVGMVALAVAALGMFNTLTVSLLERTREVGLMKAMGMKSSEVQELFLTESMIMGFFGGMFGIFLGFIGGKFISIFLSFFSIFKGVGIVDISYLPIAFVLLIIFLSLMVGVLTGIYPARRATKISALNALRYE